MFHKIKDLLLTDKDKKDFSTDPENEFNENEEYLEKVKNEESKKIIPMFEDALKNEDLGKFIFLAVRFGVRIFYDSGRGALIYYGFDSEDKLLSTQLHNWLVEHIKEIRALYREGID